MPLMDRRTAGLMSALAAIVTPGGADTAALLEPAIQLVAALASDLAAAVEFTAGGGVLGLLAILSDSSTKVNLPALTPSSICQKSKPAAWIISSWAQEQVSRLFSMTRKWPCGPSCCSLHVCICRMAGIFKWCRQSIPDGDPHFACRGLCQCMQQQCWVSW